MIFSRYNDDEIRSYCRQTIESLELWLRTIIDKEMKQKYGENYLDAKAGNSPLLSIKRVNDIKEKQRIEPQRFQRLIDAAFLDDAIYLICHPALYDQLFKPYFVSAFPNGSNELRNALYKVLTPRNHLSHANPISNRFAEQIICYSNEVIESIKKHFIQLNMQNLFNVPRFIRFKDSFGNEKHFTNTELSSRSLRFNNIKQCFLSPGDTLEIEVEVDNSYNRDEYLIAWTIGINYVEEYFNRNKLSITIEIEHVGTLFQIECVVGSKKPWHAHGHFDDRIKISYLVLPPQYISTE